MVSGDLGNDEQAMPSLSIRDVPSFRVQRQRTSGPSRLLKTSLRSFFQFSGTEPRPVCAEASQRFSRIRK